VLVKRRAYVFKNIFKQTYMILFPAYKKDRIYKMKVLLHISNDLRIQ